MDLPKNYTVALLEGGEKKMELIFICKADLNHHLLKEVRRSINVRRHPLSPLPSNPGHSAPESHAKQVLPDLARMPKGWATLGSEECFWPGSQGGRDGVPLDIVYKGPETSQNHI